MTRPLKDVVEIIRVMPYQFTIGETEKFISLLNERLDEILKIYKAEMEEIMKIKEIKGMKNIDDIRVYLVENVFQNPDVMFSDDRNIIDLPEIIASLYDCLHIAITGEPYLYMFHWANKIGSDVDDQLFMEVEK